MKYPENERILVVRPCLKTICLGVKPAAKLLSALLYQARNCPDEEPSFTIQWTQEQVIKAVCEEFTSKTLHDTAIPCLELLGYLEVDTSSYVYQYTLHLDLIHRALEVYSTPVELEKFLIVCIRSQLEKVLNELEKLPNQLEEVLIQLEKLLIVIRKTSNSKRGRKVKPQANSEAISENPRLLEIDNITKREEESEGEQSDTATSAPSLPLDAASSPSPQSDTHAHCFFCQEEAELTCRVCGKGVCYDTHGRRFPLTETDIEDYCLTCLDAHNAAILSQIRIAASTTTPVPAPSEAGTDSTRLQESEKGHTDATATDLPSRDDHRDSPAVTHSAHDDALDRAGQLDPEIDEEWCNAETEHRLPAIPKPAVPPGGTSHEQSRDAIPPRSVAVEADSGCTAPAPALRVAPGVTPPRTMRATVVPAPPKWDAQAMLARAEVLRDKPFSESARPKETKAARKLFARKPDLTEEEFTSAFQHWNTPWWHETNGPFCITDLAAVPKNKSEMRLIIALEKLAMPKKPPGGQVIQMPTTRGQQWRSSFDDPDYDMSAEFYPNSAVR